MSRMRVGIDLVQVSRIAGSLESFGDRFVRRIFTAHEAAVAGGEAERLAARFAAKEAAKKALNLEGVGYAEIEVVRAPGGEPELRLHGAARAAGEALGLHELALSMSHEGDYATAVVIARCES